MNEDVRVVWGWRPDPYRIHQERYISGDGIPTKLVRDGTIESYDPPPPDVTGTEIAVGQEASDNSHRGMIRLPRRRRPHSGPRKGSM
jgi:hypothetical protein